MPLKAQCFKFLQKNSSKVYHRCKINELKGHWLDFVLILSDIWNNIWRTGRLNGAFNYSRFLQKLISQIDERFVSGPQSSLHHSNH